MKNLAIVKSLTRSVNKLNFKVKKHSPEILIVAGVVGTVTSAVMACKATTKLSGILEDSKKEIDTIHEYIETEGFSEKYTEEDGKKDLTIVYAQTGIKVVKLYAPSVILGALSITGILASNHILRKRNIALAAAYTAIDKGFKEYRGRVIERFGEALDRELKYNIKSKEIEETIVNEDGSESKVKKTVEVVDLPFYSEYARFFDDGCLGWSKDSEYNLQFLTAKQAEANVILQSQGYLFLNDVYDMLGIPRSKAGQVVGWIYDEKNPIGDNYVDFGIFDTSKVKCRDFVNGYEKTILLDFNVDGNVWNLI